MNRRRLFFIVAPCVLLLSLLANLSIGASETALADVIDAAFFSKLDSYSHYVVLYQRLPRALIAVYAGAMMACGGAVLQGLTRNPLASPSTLGINAGATFFVVVGVFLFDLGLDAQGIAALAGAAFGFLACLFVAHLVGGSSDPRGLAFIVSGALISMLLISLANAFLLLDPARRSDFLGWITGNVNHVYADRLRAFWWIGVLALLALQGIARPLTLIALGPEHAASTGVDVGRISKLAIASVVAGTGSAVMICGPIGFVGLVVPHVVRPLVGTNYRIMLPACMATGAIACLLADVAARQAFAPYVLHTGILLDLLGGLVFVLIVRRFYLKPGVGREL